MKVALACSVGGHLTQMRQLEKLYKQHNYFFITEDTLMTRELAKKENVYLLELINRKKWNFPFLMLVIFFKTLFCLIKEKPDLIICTGALSSIPSCIIGKLMRKKVVYIESFAKMNSPTLTGKLVYKFADLFIVQWESMLRFYPKAVYGGSIY
ncbi:UDP-N-acetylglucosamine--LPS N-acetylglucosamine transferase [Paenibacillus baekrokdamisoli]|uniref:UDP-N-acetylglucosamine--LPS N-acetylglucosamine transferase n=1 Tax=Paenibacillus baekrokdamisoli TaxID=1712516 RepID=A0A3G9IVT0_9BACL|nr:PssD/Cps14F family polysaccharide biosynthesis glycosyltransferase [Paenibacillus baekrokdamisoli]MBB3067975.1 UDP-N-acetylglucosamine:LPS N-acetylglucosamine transferase [Paenibacillus baekrokdamisoli]BBH22977.1 UDP-N-acetylglucosamine--LPS N-acetylglucosamine transferase [Paenibacillus baekrokdamisoli]